MSQEQYSKQPFVLDAGPLGWIEGQELFTKQDKQSVGRYFGGLPYALPPVGPYRFRSPRPLPKSFRYGTRSNPGRYAGTTATCPQPTTPEQSQWNEDCLQLNVHIPTRKQPPTDGWPVFFFIHGGFLQFGNANITPSALVPLLNETAFEAIIVTPAYRLNALGFLASQELRWEAQKHGEPFGNQGFWDQRLALEWTAQHISLFGGNAENITVGGYSAGAYSAFYQLAYELNFLPDSCALIKRVAMWSNSPGVQPKSPQDAQQQFDDLLRALEIPLSLSAETKLRRLRATPAAQLIRALDTVPAPSFRPCADGAFVSARTIAGINTGDFARRLRARGIAVLNGECRDEHTLYRRYRTPAPDFLAVRDRLRAEFPAPAVRALLEVACGPGSGDRGDGVGVRLPLGAADWPDAFGRLVAAMQVHALERGFHAALARTGARFGVDVLRYRFDWRAKCVDRMLPPALGVTHTSDMAIWFWGCGYGDGLTEQEKEILKPWNELFAAFVKGQEHPWPTREPQEMMRLRSDGVTDVWRDDRWDEGVKIWEAITREPSVWGWIKARI